MCLLRFRFPRRSPVSSAKRRPRREQLQTRSALRPQRHGTGRIRAARLIVHERLRGARRDLSAPRRTTPGSGHTRLSKALDTMSPCAGQRFDVRRRVPIPGSRTADRDALGTARPVAGPGMAPVRGVPAGPRAGLSALGRCGPSRVLRQTRAARGLLEMAGMDRFHPGLGSSAASLPHVSGRADPGIDRCDPLVLRSQCRRLARARLVQSARARNPCLARSMPGISSGRWLSIARPSLPISRTGRRPHGPCCLELPSTLRSR